MRSAILHGIALFVCPAKRANPEAGKLRLGRPRTTNLQACHVGRRVGLGLPGIRFSYMIVRMNNSKRFPMFGPYGGLTPEHVKPFRDSEADTVWFHMFDEKQFELCERAGALPCVEFKTFRADFSVHPELVPIGPDGKPIRYGKLVQGICLSQTDYCAEIEEQLVIGMRDFSPAGIWLDYLAYAGWFETPEPDLQDNCFCDSCIEEFRNRTAIDVSSPDRIISHYAQEWRSFKSDRIAEFASRYGSIIREHNPDCIVGAYMCPWTPDEYDNGLERIFGQNYEKLADSIDIFTPLIYADKSGRPSDWGKTYLEASPSFIPRHNPVQLILDYRDFPDSLLRTVESDVPSYGVQLFQGDALFSDPDEVALFDRAVTKIRKGNEKRDL